MIVPFLGRPNGGMIFFLPAAAAVGPNFVPQKIGRILSTSSYLKPIRRKLPVDKLDLVARAKRKASRKNRFGNKPIDLNNFCEHADSGNWQRFVSEEFSRRMRDFLIVGGGRRFNSFDLISPERKGPKLKPTKCQCCQIFEGKPFRKCLLEEKMEEASSRWSDGVIFTCDVTEGHLKGNWELLASFFKSVPWPV